MAAIGVIVVLLLIIGVLFWKYQTAVNNPTLRAQTETARVLQEVSKIYLLPTDEQPTVARVEDKTKVQDQPFFVNAKNGDYLMVYSKHKLAFLYREQDNKLINVGPVSLGTTPAAKP